MRRQTRWLVWCTTLVMLGAPVPSASAQHAGPGFTSRDGARAVEVWAGVSRASSMWGQLGDMPNEALALSAVRYAQRIRQNGAMRLEYAVDVIPLALLTPTYPAVSDPCVPTCAGVPQDGQARPARGAGLNPLSLTALFRTNRVLQFRAGASAGALWFDQPVPITTAARFNLTGTLQAGLQLVGSRGNGILLMYRFHHLSNAGRGTENPGLASHMLSVGARWRLGPASR